MSALQSLSVEKQLSNLNERELKRLLVEHLTKKKLGLNWEHSEIERDKALNSNVVLPYLRENLSFRGSDTDAPAYQNLIIEGDNFDALRLLRTTHANKIRVIYIDPPYNTGNKDWVYNDHYVGKNDRWRHSQWLEFLYQRLTLARDLLTSDGVILVSINDENRARLELLMDEVFPRRRVGSLTWRTKDTGNDNGHLLSQVHEHILVYANEGFKFSGRGIDRSKFKNIDQDPRGDWIGRPLTKAHTYKDRDGTYYPIQDPFTGYWYPCDPDRVWAYASKLKPSKKKLRSDTIEELIEKDLIYFPPCEEAETFYFRTKRDLIKAIESGQGPISPRKKTPLLRLDLPDLDFWVGKRIAPGRPSLKDHWNSKPESERLAPVSSWIGGVNEEVDFNVEDEEEMPVVLRSTRGGVAHDELKAILKAKKFDYPKPLSLIKNLLEQATQPGDIILDFFAGSGTTGHAVLALNAEDEGQRRFILCSNTEATDKDSKRNICRDVCAARIKRVIEGCADVEGIEGDFAYLELKKYDPADARLDAAPEEVFQLLSLRNILAAQDVSGGSIKLVSQSKEFASVFIPEVTQSSIKALLALRHPKLAVYSSRPQTVAEKLEASGKTGTSYAIGDVIAFGQAGGQA